MADDFSFQITEKVGEISVSKTGWTLELNKVSWGGRPAKFDLRSWSPDHQKMGKGVTLTDEEIKKLGEIISALPL
ncbi:MAG: PC4/YdbC family ssDNA-binding protein [Treponema porcinum]|uniref:Transcriptional coactivator p15 (PC4) C-terminal domain-containing protein n=1 Tax=Treponema porcinum TaxID=261392 RepID=A0A1T4L5A3_TREPO|nr:MULTISPECIES: PC4/YdbC family ssDNA-binding protein [Treponema]MCI5644860.1 PC4/YdbC family ssDNA-binding protein [Treponema porcinum]MCI6180172.1 PC4/YdbC family ssDNA-binding protein [Treponema porcinum]MCI6322694.1 PC4/YdbC family ssDNA-binding protein [Treponema porcinum]MCI6722134.1 PC4/YdbC family ssDNA-binding protein [Treponema porcinum]MCI6816501.1 PC4/YdbC family ssDNA-binding protein [Treponema porcinum]